MKATEILTLLGSAFAVRHVRHEPVYLLNRSYDDLCADLRDDPEPERKHKPRNLDMSRVKPLPKGKPWKRGKKRGKR